MKQWDSVGICWTTTSLRYLLTCFYLWVSARCECTMILRFLCISLINNLSYSWMNCCQLKMLPQIPRDLDLYEFGLHIPCDCLNLLWCFSRCLTPAQGVNVTSISARSAHSLASLGFVCRANSDSHLYSCSECPVGTVAVIPFNHTLKDGYCKECPAGLC